MKKVDKNTYRGINYIKLKSLPHKQAESLRKSLTHRTLIKIIQDDVVIDDCVLYSAYEEWYETTSQNENSTNGKKQLQKVPLTVSK
ncbi:MAG: hypothetical protein ABFS32_07890 [Bacteroidota bacterium]